MLRHSIGWGRRVSKGNCRGPGLRWDRWADEISEGLQDLIDELTQAIGGQRQLLFEQDEQA